LPKVVPPAEIVGHVHSDAAAETGLRIDTPVLAGLPDTAATLIAGGVTETDETMIYYGTTGVVPLLKMDMLRIVKEPYPVADECVFDYPSYSLSVGDAVEWFRDRLLTAGWTSLGHHPDSIEFSALDQLATEAPPGCEALILLPYFLGQRTPEFNPQARGVYFGITKSHGLGHFYRAVLESFGYGIRHSLEANFPKEIPFRRVVAVGGGAQSSLWRQIVSDITGLEQEYIPGADGPIGDAFLAGLALGWFEDFKVLKNEWLRDSIHTEPQPENQRVYDGNFSIYSELHGVLGTTFDHHQRTLKDVEAIRQR
jgi:xylulokinase